jgi:hypothetical protein
MACPRCGGDLDRYQHGDDEAVACSDCGWTGISVDHHGEIRTPDTWSDALNRFHQKNRTSIATDVSKGVETALPAGEKIAPTGDADPDVVDGETRGAEPEPAANAAGNSERSADTPVDVDTEGRSNIDTEAASDNPTDTNVGTTSETREQRDAESDDGT